jgi:hypothetical protein
MSTKYDSVIRASTSRTSDDGDMYLGYEKITSSDPEVKRLLNNPSLKKIFYGIDYAPLNVQ